MARHPFARLWREHASVYANDIVTWAQEQWVIRTTGELIVLEPYQAALLRLAFTRDADGLFPYETVIWSEPKKSGKTEIAALVGAWVTLTEPGIPEIYVIANDLEQAQGRAFRAMKEVRDKNPMLRRSVKARGKVLTFPDGGTVTAIPVDYAGEAGANQVLTEWDELWAYTSEKTQRLWDEFTPVPTRRNSIRLITTYAGFKGESVLLEGLYKQVVRPKNLLDPARYPDVYVDGEVLAFWSHTPRMPWQLGERGKRYYENQKRRLRPGAYARLHDNRWVRATDRFIGGAEWDALPRIPFPEPSKAYPCYAMVDAAHKRDATAVVVVGYERDVGPFLVRHRLWQPSKGRPVDPEEVAIPFLQEVRRDFDLRLVAADPAHFESALNKLRRQGFKTYEFTQTPANLLRMGQALWDGITLRRLRVYAAPDLGEHVQNAQAKDTGRGFQLVKGAESKKIDGAVALAGAEAVATELGPTDSRRARGIAFLGGSNPEGEAATELAKAAVAGADVATAAKVEAERERRTAAAVRRLTDA